MVSLCMISFLCVERICSEFEIIQEKSQEVPENIDAMAQMVDYMILTKTKTLEDLNEKLQVTNWTFCPSCCVLQKNNIS